MRRSSGSDHLAHSFTDLMTSLMVIFILLLLIFLNHQASVNTNTTQALLKEMKQRLASSDLRAEDIRVDQKDPFTIVVAVPDERMTFRSNRYELNPDGEQFVHREMPRLAGILCAPKYRDSVENVMVEGYSDSTPYRGATPEESQSRNLKLSQDRSMEVVKETLVSLAGQPDERACFLQKLSASGRGEQDLLTTAERSRRVVIKVRVNASQGVSLAKTMGARILPPPRPTPQALQVLDLMARLRAVPVQHVTFQLTEDDINRYLAYALAVHPRPGIDSLTVKIFPHNYISTFAQIDFDAVTHWNPLLVPAMVRSMLRGKRLILLDYRFSVRDAKVTFTIEKAAYQNTSLPRFLAREVLQAVAWQQPEHVDLDEPQPLPFGLRQLQTAGGVISGTN